MMMKYENSSQIKCHQNLIASMRFTITHIHTSYDFWSIVFQFFFRADTHTQTKNDICYILHGAVSSVVVVVVVVVIIATYIDARFSIM